eukprot:CAMPEP_0113664224 /NCGR_PEP_ID=MMETSP0038_2-20120614/1609_1 /TAXON_ID=2898 /ORGANISM="Cryptomonas paramecium" /LENGTH=165 /DNA_ID=CAMNT_0000579399 /DNA_START=31 /DNA_END=524 /DNA_ORIENTATION=- /assembly_acc=CAM_ASM_000170
MATMPVTPAVVEHNKFLESFHQSLSQDPSFLELIQGASNASNSKSFKYVSSIFDEKQADTALGAAFDESDLDSPVFVTGIESKILSKSKDELITKLYRLVILWDGCKKSIVFFTENQDAKHAHMRMMHSLETLCITFRCIFSKNVTPEEVLACIDGGGGGGGGGG